MIICTSSYPINQCLTHYFLSRIAAALLISHLKGDDATRLLEVFSQTVLQREPTLRAYK